MKSRSSSATTISRRGGNINVAALTRMASQQILDNFRQLPSWGKSELARSLMTLFPDAFAQRPVDTVKGVLPVEKKRPEKKQKVASLEHGVPDGQSTSGKGTVAAPGSTTVPIPATQQKVTTSAGKTKPSPKGKGIFDPILIGLDFQQRLAKQNSVERNTNKSDKGLLSAALSAIRRARSEDVPEKEIYDTLFSSKESMSAYAALWPSKTQKKKAALKQASKLVSTIPEIRCVDTFYVVTTTHLGTVPGAVEQDSDSNAMLVEDSETPDQVTDPAGPHSLAKLSTSTISFHSERRTEEPISPELVQSFLKGERKNYNALSNHLHISVRTRRIILFWLTSSQASVRWGDDDSEMSIKSAKSPKFKKRKRNSTDGEG
jgi:hypothetical protein